MAKNFFDQFDQTDDQSNFFDRFDAPERETEAPKKAEEKGLIERVADFFRPEKPKSVMEGYKPSPQEIQKDIDRRLSYGAGPISQETVKQADDLRSGRPTKAEPNRVAAKVARAMDEQALPSSVETIARAKDPEIVRRTRDAKADEFRAPGEWAVDTLSGLSQGALSLVQLPVDIIAPSSEIADKLRKTQEELRAAESDVAVASRERLRERIQSEDGFLDKYVATVKELVTNPTLGLNEAVRQLPNFLGVVGAAKLGGAVTGGLAGAAGRTGAGLTAARAAGTTVGGAGASMVMSGGDAAGDVYEQLTDRKRTPLNVWKQNEDFRELVAAGKSEQQAIEEIATTKARMAAMVTAPLGLLGFMGAEAAVASKGLGKAARDALTIGGIAKFAAKDLIGEQLEEGGTQFGANVFKRTVDPRQSLSEGVPEAAATALVTSAPFTAVGARANAQEVLRMAEESRARQAEIQLRQAPDAATAAAAANEMAGNVDAMTRDIDEYLGRRPTPPSINPETEQQFGLDALRMTPPAPAAEPLIASAAPDLQMPEIPPVAPRAAPDLQMPEIPPAAPAAEANRMASLRAMVDRDSERMAQGLPPELQLPDIPQMPQRAAPTPPAPIAPEVSRISSLRDMVDRNAELTAQADSAGTAFDRRMAQDQAQTALELQAPPRREAPRYADLAPMTEQQAAQRLGVLRDMAANEGGNALELAVVPHPSQAGRFAIGTQELPSLDLQVPPRRETPAPEAQNRIESAALVGEQAQRRAEDAPRLAMVDRAKANIEARGGVASPFEAEVLRQANAGQPYDRIDPTLGRPATVDEQLTAATGVAVGTEAGLGNRPRSSETQQPAPAPFQFDPNVRGRQRETQEIPLVEAVPAFISTMQRENTPAAQAFVRDYEAGRITDTDVQTALEAQRRGAQTPSQIIEQAATQAPAAPTGVQPATTSTPRAISPALAEAVTLYGGRPYSPTDLTPEGSAQRLATASSIAPTQTADGLQVEPTTTPRSDFAGRQDAAAEANRALPPRPQRIQNQPTAQLTDVQLEQIAGNDALPAISRRGASIELQARRLEQESRGAGQRRDAQQAEAQGRLEAAAAEGQQASLAAPSVESRLATAATQGRLAQSSGGRIVTSSATLSTQRQPVPGSTGTINDVEIERDADGNEVLDPTTGKAKTRPVQHNYTIVDAGTLGLTGKLVQQVGRIFGKRVAVFESDTMQADGFVLNDDNRTIYLNAKSQISPVAVFGHELTHLMKRENAQAYTALQTVVERQLRDGAMDDFGKEYGAGANLEELSSDLVGNRFQESGFWRDVFLEIGAQQTEGARGVVLKLANSVNKAINSFLKVVQQGGYQADQYVRDLSAVKAAVKQATVDYVQSQRGAAVAMDQEAQGLTAPAGNMGAGEATFSVGAQLSKQRNPLGFYSALSDGIDNIKTNAAPAAGWRDAVKGLVNKGQVKADEVEWTGLNDWLDMQQGRVTKEQVAEYLKQGGVQVKETVLGGGFTKAMRLEMEDLSDILRSRRTEAQARRLAELSDLANAEDTKGRGTKFGDYALPGGENYREVLLTLPTGKQPVDAMSRRELADWYAKEVGYDPLEEDPQMTTEDLRDLVRGVNSEGGAVRAASVTNEYKSSHWDQPNVLAHLRVNDRTDAGGSRVLFVEEIQSDWGQDRKKGKDVPAAPFVGKTEGWLNLALKRAIVMAAEGGYDKIAFTNGQQNADRYDLSKQVDTITYAKSKSGDTVSIDAIKDGRNAFSRANLPMAEVEGLLGKEIAQKIANGEGEVNADGYNELSGLDLQVGGEGMKAFYDAIVPNAVRTLAKKLGGRVEMVELGEKPDRELRYQLIRERRDMPDGPERDAINRRIDAIGNAIGAANGKEALRGPSLQPGLVITPELKAKVAEGLPLFSRQRKDSTSTQDRPTDEATGLPLNDDGTVTVYHHTSRDRAEAIRRTGMLQSAGEPDVYVTTRRETDTGYGDAAVPIRVRPDRLQIDDEFPNGRTDYRLSVGRPGGAIPVKVDRDAAFSPQRAQREAAAEASARNENRVSVVVGAKPGEFNWNFAAKDAKVPPFAVPAARGPRLEKVGTAVHEILVSSGFRRLAQDAFGISGLRVVPLHGSWQNKAEPSFALYADGLTFDQADGLSKMLGFAFAQDATVVYQPTSEQTPGEIPAVYIGSAKKLSDEQLKAVLSSAQAEGLDYSTTADGKAVKFLHFGNEEELAGLMEKTARIAQAAGLQTPKVFYVRSQLNEADSYTKGPGGSTGQAVWFGDGGADPSGLFRRTVDHVLVPYAKAVGAEGYRFAVQRFAERFGLDAAQQDVVRNALIPKSGLAKSTAAIASGEIKLDIVPTGKKGKQTKVSVNDILWALQNYSAQAGLIEPGDYSPRTKKVIAEALADEIVHHVTSSTSGKSAIGWYDRALKAAKSAYSEIFPEIATDPDRSMLFDAVLGIASQGNDVFANSIFAGRVYQLVRDGNTLSDAVRMLRGTFGEETRAIENNLLKLEQLLNRNGYVAMRDFFNQKDTVSAINARLRADTRLHYNGKPLGVDGAAEQKVTGWMVFGPKIGSFINNLHGDYSTLTADLWFSRTWNRILGFSFVHTPALEAEQYQTFVSALASEYAFSRDVAGPIVPKSISKTGKVNMPEFGQDAGALTDARIEEILSDPDEALAYAAELEAAYRKGGYKEKSDLRRAAKNWIENRQDSVAAPRTDRERAFQQSTVEAAQKIIKRRTGMDITIADIQAALWYYEKDDLFKALGGTNKKSEAADYSGAAEQMLDLYRRGDLFFAKTDGRYVYGAKGSYLPAGAQQATPSRPDPVAVADSGARDQNLQFSRRRKPDPEKTVIAYKLFRVNEKNPGQLFPLFIGKNDPVEVGIWYDADDIPTKGFSARPGWHAGDSPMATHIGEKSRAGLTAPDRRPANQVWAEIEMSADVDWQPEANRRGTNAQGKVVAVKADIKDQIPEDGFYRYKTNPNMTGTWLIGGAIKVNRVLSDAEVEAINANAGVADLPRAEPFDADRFGFKFSRQRAPDTPEFKRWFGNSAVVDANGDPLVVWRGGTPSNVIATDNPTNGSAQLGPGAYFGGRGLAEDFAQYRENGRADPYYLSLQRPFDETRRRAVSPEMFDAFKAKLAEIGVPKRTIDELEQPYRGALTDLAGALAKKNRTANWTEASKINAALREAGFDGIIADWYAGGEQYVAFRPNQIKAATNERPTDSPDITASRRRLLIDRDELGRVQFGAGAAAYDLAATVANNVLDKVAMKPISKDLSRSMRKMRLEVERAQNLAVDVASKLKELSDDERQMISDVIEGELRAGVTPPRRVLELAASMQSIMSEQSAELVRLKMLSPEAAGRWDGKYLPRFYESKIGDEAKQWAKAAAALFRKQKTMQGIKGDSLKSRGMFQSIPAEDLDQWTDNGWEVRDQNYRPGVDKEVLVWRDFTRQERENMGEIRDAMFRFVMGYTRTQRDAALGRLYENLASTVASRTPQGDFVKVPDTKVDDTQAKRYGALAGMYVPREVLDHLSAYDDTMQNDLMRIYRKGLSMWKEGKTVLNPTAHANNVLSNLTMAHFAGVSYWDVHKYAGTVRDLAKGSPMVAEAKAAGLFGSTFNRGELLDAMPEQLKALAQMSESRLSRGVDMVWNAMSFWLRKPLGKAYEAEDLFFRYLIYRDSRQRGLDPDDAVDFAQDFIFTYDDLPKGARILRDTAIPFFSYTYKAVPALAATAMKYPWRFAAPAAALYGLNAAMYAMAAAVAGGEDDDWLEVLRRYATDKGFRERAEALEAEERENLPPWMKGFSALRTPKAIRLGTDTLTGLPLFLDAARMIPGGDLLDAENNAGGVAVLQPFMSFSPVLTTTFAMFGNRDMFTGKDISNKLTDSSAEATEKRAAWLWKQVSPAIAVGNYHFDRAMNAVANLTGEPILGYTGFGRDGLPVQPKHAVAQSVGIKVRPIDLDTSAEITESQRERILRELDWEIRRIDRLLERGAITEEAADKQRERQEQKKDFVQQRLTVDGEPRK